MKEVVYAGWKECKTKGERNQKRVKGRCGIRAWLNSSAEGGKD